MPGISYALTRVRLQDDRCRHIHRVLRSTPGDILACGKKNGKMGTGVIVSMARDAVEMDVCLDREPPAPLPLTLVLSAAPAQDA